MDEEKVYWHDAHEYTEWKIDQLREQGEMAEAFKLCMQLIEKIDSDSIQLLLQNEMIADGYFDEPEGD